MKKLKSGAPQTKSCQEVYVYDSPSRGLYSADTEAEDSHLESDRASHRSDEYGGSARTRKLVIARHSRCSNTDTSTLPAKRSKLSQKIEKEHLLLEESERVLDVVGGSSDRRPVRTFGFSVPDPDDASRAPLLVTRGASSQSSQRKCDRDIRDSPLMTPVERKFPVQRNAASKSHVPKTSDFEMCVKHPVDKVIKTEPVEIDEIEHLTGGNHTEDVFREDVLNSEQLSADDLLNAILLDPNNTIDFEKTEGGYFVFVNGQLLDGIRAVVDQGDDGGTVVETRILDQSAGPANVQNECCDERVSSLYIVSSDNAGEDIHRTLKTEEDSGAPFEEVNHLSSSLCENNGDGADDDGEAEEPPLLEPEEIAMESEEVHCADPSDSNPPINEESYADAEEIVPLKLSNGLSNEDQAMGNVDLRTVEFNFLDNKHICCGLCGEIVPYDALVNEHLPTAHAELLGNGVDCLEEIPYEEWLRDRIYFERKSLDNGFRSRQNTRAYPRTPLHPNVRRVSQFRVNVKEMSLPTLEGLLVRKMVEKMGRHVDVSLIDKVHAKCGECGAIISLNKKFEVSHVVRHFNAWHPTTHRCSMTWASKSAEPGFGKPLGMQDFAVVDVQIDAVDNLQCIWCGMMLDKRTIAMHFIQVHQDDIEVPNCALCIEELVVNACLLEQFGEEFEVSMPDERHYYCQKLDNKFTSETQLQKAVEQKLFPSGSGGTATTTTNESESFDSNGNKQRLTNSQMRYGKNHKRKRCFTAPQLRQCAPPVNSRYITVEACGFWRCRLCDEPILAAVMSSGCIKHFNEAHPDQAPGLKFEVNKTRLEYMSDGCMELVTPNLVECLLCQLCIGLHRPYNLCRGVRHLQKNHREMMPEFHAQSYVPVDDLPPFQKMAKRKPCLLTSDTANEKTLSTLYPRTRLSTRFVRATETVSYGSDPNQLATDEHIEQEITETIVESGSESQGQQFGTSEFDQFVGDETLEGEDKDEAFELPPDEVSTLSMELGLDPREVQMFKKADGTIFVKQFCTSTSEFVHGEDDLTIVEEEREFKNGHSTGTVPMAAIKNAVAEHSAYDGDRCAIEQLLMQMIAEVVRRTR